MLRASLPLLVASLFWTLPAQATPFPTLEGNFEEALEQARSQGKKLLVKVFTTWCGPCKRMDSQVLASEQMLALTDRVALWSINAETPAGEEFKKRFHYERYPTTLFLDDEGNEVYRIVGFRALPGFMQAVNRWLSGKAPGQGTAPAANSVAGRFATAFANAWNGNPAARGQLTALIELDADGKAQIAPNALLALGQWVELRHGNDPVAAIQTLRSLLKRFPSSAAADNATAPLAEAMAAQGDVKAAQQLLTKAIHKKKRSPASYIHLALFAARTDGADRARALATVAKGCKLHADAAPLWAAYSELAEANGDKAQASTAIERVLEALPNHPWYLERKQRLGR